MQWVAHTADALGRGMTHPDTLWYHQPFAVRFLQRGSFTGLDGLGYEAARWFPFNGQLLHAMAAAPFSRDIWSPLLNLGWMALALLAAWCIGLRNGTSPLTMLAGAVVLGVPALAGTQPGQASTDVAGIALLLTSVALLLEGRLATSPTAIAGLAAGMAISTKVTIAAPFVVLVSGVALLTVARRKAPTLVAWTVAVVGTGTFWFARNWVLTDTPLPWFDLSFGPLRLPTALVEPTGASLAESLGGPDTWSGLYLPGLAQGLGRAWPVVLAVALAGGMLAIARGPALERLAGIVVLLGVVGYAFTPLTGGLSFAFNLRYLTPALALGAVIGPAVASPDLRRRWLVLAALVAAVALGASSPHRERVPSWPAGTVVPALVVVVTAVVTVVVIRTVVARRPELTRSRVGPAVVLALAVVAAGWPMQRVYLEGRYVDAGLHIDAIHERFRTISGASVAVLGTDETFPMFGLDLSNEVRRGDDAGWDAGEPCPAWRRLLGDRYDYVVLTRFGFGFYPRPSEDVIADDPASTLVVRDGDSSLYRIDGALDPGLCTDA